MLGIKALNLDVLSFMERCALRGVLLDHCEVYTVEEGQELRAQGWPFSKSQLSALQMAEAV